MEKGEKRETESSEGAEEVVKGGVVAVVGAVEAVALTATQRHNQIRVTSNNNSNKQQQQHENYKQNVH